MAAEEVKENIVFEKDSVEEVLAKYDSAKNNREFIYRTIHTRTDIEIIANLTSGHIDFNRIENIWYIQALYGLRNGDVAGASASYDPTRNGVLEDDPMSPLTLTAALELPKTFRQNGIRFNRFVLFKSAVNNWRPDKQWKIIHKPTDDPEHVLITPNPSGPDVNIQENPLYNIVTNSIKTEDNVDILDPDAVILSASPQVLVNSVYNNWWQYEKTVLFRRIHVDALEIIKDRQRLNGDVNEGDSRGLITCFNSLLEATKYQNTDDCILMLNRSDCITLSLFYTS